LGLVFQYFETSYSQCAEIRDIQIQVQRKLFNVESLCGQFGQLTQEMFNVPDENLMRYPAS